MNLYFKRMSLEKIDTDEVQKIIDQLTMRMKHHRHQHIIEMLVFRILVVQIDYCNFLVHRNPNLIDRNRNIVVVVKVLLMQTKKLKH